MKKLGLIFFALCCSCFAWDCPAGQIRQQAPAGTPTTAPYYDVVEGIAFVCVPTPTPTATGTAVTNTSNSNSASNSTSNSNSSSNQTQDQKQKQTQTQSNTSTNANQSEGGSVSNVGNSVTNVAAPDIPVNSAYAPPVFSTVNCFKGWSGGGQSAVAGLSFGGGGIDKNCAAERAAQDYFASGNRLAFCKVMVTTKQSKDAGVTLNDCMDVPIRVQPISQPTPINVQPAPQITVIQAPPTFVYLSAPPAASVLPAPIVPANPVQHAARRKIGQPKPCYVIQDQCVVVGKRLNKQVDDNKGEK
jgi:hypothetical protein